MDSLKLISSDFDGTLIGHGSDGRCSPGIALALEAHRDLGGLWAINTGRGLQHAIDGLRRFSGPVEPDFLLTNEREVYRWDGHDAWIAHGDWNERCRSRHDELFEASLEVFAVIQSLTKTMAGISIISEDGRPVGLVTETEPLMEILVKEIDLAATNFVDFSYQRNSIYLRFCHRDYHKGSALEELCRLENIPASEVFAVGDHFNDIPMLNPKYALMTACPANAIEEVKEIVRLSNGYVSEKAWAEGVADALIHYKKNRAPESAVL